MVKLTLSLTKNTISTLLKYFFNVIEWSREILLERWVRDPDKCCQIAGVQVPMSVQSTKKFYLNGLLQQTNLNEEAQLNVNDQTIVSYINLNLVTSIISYSLLVIKLLFIIIIFYYKYIMCIFNNQINTVSIIYNDGQGTVKNTLF